ncbi:cyclin-dependent kinase 2 isoform X1 [Biomphalaria glabrata]|nr:cyclin-dependent kinase 2 isoform X1 [Biomphalaria glabrata]
MERYENLGLVGEGSYGMVLKCKHKETGQLVAIKKFLESEDDKIVQKIALREIKMLKQLRHDNLVNLIETFRKRKRLYLVFEFVDHTILDELEKCPNGLDENTCRRILWQVLKGTEFCHSHNIIHRDIKPENLLISKSGIVKICDFGFARTLAQPGEAYTDYVATRWYRAPELLVGDTKYGRAVDIWAIGCLLSEMLTGEPLFPGDSDIDQLYHIIRCFGNLPSRHKEVFHRNPLFVGMRLPEVKEVAPFGKKYPRVSEEAVDVMKLCLQLDPDQRPTCTDLLKHNLFTKDGFGPRFVLELRQKIAQEHSGSHNLRGKETSRTLERSLENSNETLEKLKNTNENHKTIKAAVKKKKKTDMKESQESIIEDKANKKSTETSSKVPAKQIPLKPVSTASVVNQSNHAISLPPATTATAIINSNASHTISQEEVTTDNHDKESREHVPQNSHQNGGSIPPITSSHQTRMPKLHTTFLSPAIVKLKSDEKWSPRNPLMNGNRTSTFRSNEKFKKVSQFPKKSPSKTQYNYSASTSPQSVLIERSSVQEDSQEKLKNKSQVNLDKSHDDRPGLSLPEVKRAADVNTKGKDKQLSPFKKSSFSSIPHINNNEPLTSSSSQMEVTTGHEREGQSSTLPNV